MKRTLLLSLTLLILILSWASSTFGEVPKQISYQGRLTNSVGTPVNDTLALVFTICSDSLCAHQLWTETLSSVAVIQGIFDVQLGSEEPIPATVFSGKLRWLSISFHGQTVNRRLALSSVPYAYQSLAADTADYARNAGSFDCVGCDNVFVNSVGPDSVCTTSGTAFFGRVLANDSKYTIGILGYAANSSSGIVYGGRFSAEGYGTGIQYGVSGYAYGNSAAAVYGSYGWAQSSSSGTGYGGFFKTISSGTGEHHGVRGEASSGTTAHAYGVSGQGENSSAGQAYGGNFVTTSTGTGDHFGVYARADGSSAGTTYGVVGQSSNLGSGVAYGGSFVAIAGAGTGQKIGVYAYSPVSGTNAAGYFDGDVHVTGSFKVDGAKSAVVKTGDQEYRAVYCQESPENWFEDFGEGQLISGSTHIDLDPVFQRTVTIDAANPMKVFVQLMGDCRGVYITRGTTGFDVKELQGGNSNVPFSYRVVAKRKGLENVRLETVNMPSAEEQAAMRSHSRLDSPMQTPIEQKETQ
jgi:hypothetical protein